MPRDTVERAIKKATGTGGGEDYQEVRYEGHGAAGVAVIVEALTDNRNRTASSVRAAFSKHGGSLGESNAVSFMFDRLGVLRFPLAAGTADAVMEAAIEAGADNAETLDDAHEITCKPDDFFAVRDAVEAKLGSPDHARVEWRPNMSVTLDEEKARAVLKLLDALEENDDVQHVYANFDIPDAVMQKLSA
jgi:YebC/PmpR family DNA-binding regulatory protein